MSQGSSTTGVRTIVVATDFSANASLALDRASELARDHGARIVIVHAMTMKPSPLGGPDLMDVPPDFEEQVRDASMKRLNELVESVSRDGVEAAAELDDGHAPQTIVAVAERTEADLIVIGTRGTTGFQHLLLGSVAEEVVREAHCPVLTVHPGDADPIDRLETVPIPTDFSEDAEEASGAVMLLFGPRAASAKVILLHAYHIPAVVSPLVGYYPAAPVLLADAERLAREALQPLADKLSASGFAVEILGREGDPASVVTEVASSSNVSLIAMGTRGLSKFKQLLLGSTAQRVVQHATCPVLTVRRPGS